MWLLSVNDNDECKRPCFRQVFLCKKKYHSSRDAIRSSLSGSFGPYFSLQGNICPSLTVEQFTQSTLSRDDHYEEGEENGLSSLFDVPNSNVHTHSTRTIEPTYNLVIRNNLWFIIHATLRVIDERQCQE